MNEITNTQITLKSRPIGMPVEDNFKIIKSSVPEVRNGEVLIKIIWLSLDPYMRGRMSDAKSYANPVSLGDVITGGAVGKIIKSSCAKFCYFSSKKDD